MTNKERRIKQLGREIDALNTKLDRAERWARIWDERAERATYMSRKAEHAAERNLFWADRVERLEAAIERKEDRLVRLEMF